MSSAVWLTISSFRNDQQIAALLEKAHGEGNPFQKILVVDSLGTQHIPELIHSRGWRDVTYVTYPRNLGSGENLRERLRLAADAGADFAYALNHDASLDFGLVKKLLQATAKLDRPGAVYPLAYFSAAGRYNLTGTRELPLHRRLVAQAPDQPLIDVFWSSSNGALYALEPVRKGILPWEAMWMGWEDLEYGWQLFSRGYRQVIASDAVFPDNAEYRQSSLGSTVDKPPWRTYYFIRNLMLAVRRTRPRPLFYAAVYYRFAAEAMMICLARDSKAERLRLLWRGMLDGFRGREDAGLLP